MTAIVMPPAWIVAACAAPSIPVARPETTVAPAETRFVASRAAIARPAFVARRVPTTATAAARLRARPDRPGRTGRAAAWRWPPAEPGTSGPPRSRRAARAHGSGRASAGAPLRGDDDRLRDRRQDRPARASEAIDLVARTTERPAASLRRVATPRGGSRLPEPYRRRSAAMPTGPRPSTQVRTAQASRSDMPAPSWLVGPLDRRRVLVRPAAAGGAASPVSPVGPAAPTPSTSGCLGVGQALIGRPEPGGLVEVRLRHGPRAPARSAIVLATRSRRSVPRPLARSSSASWTTRRSLDPDRPHADRSRRPVRRPFRSPGVRSSARTRAAATRGATVLGPLGVPAADERQRRDPRHRHPQVDPIAQRSRDAPLVSLRLAAAAGAGCDPWSRR